MATISSNSMYGVSIQLKCKKASEWGANDVLLAGEIGFELDTKKAKLGDGNTSWDKLGYYTDPVISGIVDALTTRVGTNESNISSLTDRMTAAEGVNTTQGTNITSLQERMTAAEGVNTTQGSNITSLQERMTAAEGVNTTQGTNITSLQERMTAAEGVNDTQQADINALKGITVISANPAPKA